MKNVWAILVAIATIILATTVFAQVNPEGIISCWQFDEGSGTTVYDSVGYNDGTIYGGVIWVSGALEMPKFDGDDWIMIPYDPSLEPANEITVSGWAKTPSGSARAIVEKIWVPGKKGYRLRIWENHKVRFQIGNGATVVEAISTSLFNDDEWHFIVGTFDGQNAKIYVDGVLENTDSFASPTTIVHTGGVSSIGDTCVPGDPLLLFNDTIDEVAIYNRTLSAEEIQQFYQNGSGCGDIVPATIDIDPDTLNLASKGKPITGYIELEEGFDVADIDVNTILLNNTIFAESEPTEIGDYDDDGIPDLMVKFDRSAVQEILEVGDEVEIVITGEVAGEYFEGSDTIRVKDKYKK